MTKNHAPITGPRGEVQISDGKVESVEALVRWSHPKLGMLSPDDFVPLAEHTGLIDALTTHVLEESLRQCRTWREEGSEIGDVGITGLLEAVNPMVELVGLMDRKGLVGSKGREDACCQPRGGNGFVML